MSNGTAGAIDLMDHLLGAYDELKRRLVRKLGSEELAGDALQDTWMRLSARRDRLDAVQNPAAYLLRMAMNTVIDRQRADHRLLSLEEVDTLMDMADPAPARRRRPNWTSRWKTWSACCSACPSAVAASCWRSASMACSSATWPIASVCRCGWCSVS